MGEMEKYCIDRLKTLEEMLEGDGGKVVTTKQSGVCPICGSSDIKKLKTCDLEFVSYGKVQGKKYLFDDEGNECLNCGIWFGQTISNAREVVEGESKVVVEDAYRVEEE